LTLGLKSCSTCSTSKVCAAEEKTKKQQEITAAIITAQVQERSFLGEELHDNINQILATAKLFMDCALSDDGLRINHLKESKHLIQNAMEEIRKLSKTLLPPSVGENGLQEALTDVIEKIKLVNDKIQFDIDWQIPNENILNEKLGWRDYGGKHHESVFTKFYQAHILPVKFNVDKRKAHLSTLICSKQITREEALVELKKPLYNPAELEQDFDFVCKKLEFTKEEMQAYLKAPPVSHYAFKSDQWVYDLLSYFQKKLKIAK